LAAIWGEVLGREGLGVEDNFFDLGGHSIAVTRVLSRMEAQFGVALSPREFFEHATIAAQAGLLEEQLAEQGEMVDIEL
jgi:acyl carrier protein